MKIYIVITYYDVIYVGPTLSRALAVADPKCSAVQVWKDGELIGDVDHTNGEWKEVLST